MAKKNKKTIEQNASVIRQDVVTIPQYIIDDKNVFRNMLKRIHVVTVNGRTVTADTHIMDLIKKMTFGDANALNHLTKYHPILWITHAIGKWSEDCYLKNPVTVLSSIQDSWFETIRTNGIYRQGNGMSDYSWDEFKRNWNEVMYSGKYGDYSAEDVINWLRVKHEEQKMNRNAEREKEDKLKEEMAAKVKRAQEEGARRVKEIEEAKARAAAEEEARIERELKAKEEAQKRAEELEERLKAEAEEKERKEAEEFQRMLEEEQRENDAARKREETKQKRIANVAKARERKEQMARERSVAIETHVADYPELGVKPIKDDDLFVETSVSPEVDTDLFNDSGTLDFLKPIYRQPGSFEVRLHSEDGQFRFGDNISRQIIDSSFFRMHIEVSNSTFYFTFDRNGGVESFCNNSCVMVNRKTGVDQMISRLGHDSECLFLKLSSNVSVNRNKIAFKVETILEK